MNYTGRYMSTRIPLIKRIIYNLGTKAYPVLDDKGKRVKNEDGTFKMSEPVKILTTVVWFDDGTKATVSNSQHDGLTLDNDGYATDCSKELGLVYAIIKRLYGNVADDGTVCGNGLSRKLHDAVKYGYDTQREAAKAAATKADSVKAYTEAKENAKPKTPRPSLYDSAKALTEAAANLNSLVQRLSEKL